MQVSAPAAAALQPQMTDALVPSMQMQNFPELLASRALSSLLSTLLFPGAGASLSARPNSLALVVPPTQVQPEVVSATAQKGVEEASPLPLQTPAITLPTKAETPAPEPKKEIQPEETLEDFEQEAFDALQKRNQSKGMKRPASAKASAKVAAASKKATKALKLGCRKCRGAKAGCEQCRNPEYTGQRLTKEQWKSLAKKTGLK